MPGEYLTLIGGIVTQFNMLDNLLTVMLVELTGNDFKDIKAHVPFANMNFGVKKVLLDLVVKTKEGVGQGSPLDAYTNTLQQSLVIVQAKRNAVAHSTWSVENGTVLRRRFRAKKQVEIETTTVVKED